MRKQASFCSRVANEGTLIPRTFVFLHFRSLRSWTCSKMPRPPSPSIPEKEFLWSTLKRNLRLDGRLPLEMRKPKLTFGSELGWVECAMGKTRYDALILAFVRQYESKFIVYVSYSVLAQVDGKMVKPTPERPLEGIITINSEISPMASSEYEPGRWVCICRLYSRVLCSMCGSSLQFDVDPRMRR